ncbi:Gfo/Idh/MocA family protein [Mucilaginibacter boryungensis]|uniref:Gfo/Idh/MocA family oxidoreductase n=1 Tax=Mucilaginibacter boryungensis TaxID=768480 RepID=A0ABR9XH94_9SPHI|nr:Gfo/Idh/MocA family oxidoreductase [Mucilaginibacter boryungensis]MBE9666570.1 Gfo/Idh/MocA family oxidoreductase [Mucilaginibacter boryungensis]
MERRTFVKSAGILTGGLVLNQFKTLAADSAGIFKIGVIGCGDRGKGVMHVINQFPDKFQITAICDVLDFRLKEAQKVSTGAPYKSYTDYRQLLDDKSIDIVLIAVPLNMHYPIAVDALKADKHLYLEKTMTFTISQALDLVKLAKSRPKQIIQVGHQYRYSPLYYRVKEMISKGYLGKISQIDCRWDRNGNWRRPVPDPSLERAINWRMYKEYSGGLVAELLSHQIDFINWAFDTHPTEFQAMGGIDIFKDGRETYDNVQLMLRYPEQGMIGNFGATCGNAHDGYLFKIKGTKGTVSLLTDRGVFYPEKELLKEKGLVDGVTGATRITWNKEGGTPILAEPTKDGTWYALKSFYEKIASQTLPDSNVFTGAKTALSVHSANQALYSREIVYWKKEYSVI